MSDNTADTASLELGNDAVGTSEAPSKAIETSVSAAGTEATLGSRMGHKGENDDR